MVESPETLRIAIATNGQDELPKGHFGEAVAFTLVDLSQSQAHYRSEVSNSTSPHSGAGHGGIDKASQIGVLMKSNDVEVLVSREFGPNIQRMKAHFLPVVVHRETVAEAINLLQANWERLVTEWDRGTERRHLVLR